MAKTSNDQAIMKYDAPKRIEPTAPANGVTLESLCNGGDIILRGVGKSFVTEKGLATPVFFQTLDDYERVGPVDLEMMYAEDGKPYLTGKPADELDLDEDGNPRHVYQFLTASVIVLRAARSVTEQPDPGLTCRVSNKRSATTGNVYYTLE